MHSRCPIPWIKIKPEMLEVHQQVMYSLQGKLTIQNRDVKKKKTVSIYTIWGLIQSKSGSNMV
jgi:hypothetical protein